MPQRVRDADTDMQLVMDSELARQVQVSNVTCVCCMSDKMCRNTVYKVITL